MVRHGAWAASRRAAPGTFARILKAIPCAGTKVTGGFEGQSKIVSMVRESLRPLAACLLFVLATSSLVGTVAEEEVHAAMGDVQSARSRPELQSADGGFLLCPPDYCITIQRQQQSLWLWLCLWFSLGLFLQERQRKWEVSSAALYLKHAASRALRQRGWRKVGRLVAAARCSLAQARLVSELEALRLEEETAADSLAKARALRGRGEFSRHFRGLRPLLEQLQAPALAATLRELGFWGRGRFWGECPSFFSPFPSFWGAFGDARRAEVRLAEAQEEVRSCAGCEQIEMLLPRRDAVLPTSNP